MRHRGRCLRYSWVFLGNYWIGTLKYSNRYNLRVQSTPHPSFTKQPAITSITFARRTTVSNFTQSAKQQLFTASCHFVILPITNADSEEIVVHTVHTVLIWNPHLLTGSFVMDGMSSHDRAYHSYSDTSTTIVVFVIIQRLTEKRTMNWVLVWPDQWKGAWVLICI